jgi:hypothetical protein
VTACDYTIVQNATGARKDPKHKVKYHVRNQWAFWIVLRNGPACYGPGRRLKHELVWQACGKPFWACRSDARTHDGACRRALHGVERCKAPASLPAARTTSDCRVSAWPGG